MVKDWREFGESLKKKKRQKNENNEREKLKTRKIYGF